MSSRTVHRTGRVIGFGIIVLIVGFTIAWLGGYGYLPLDPLFVVGATIFLFLVTLCLSITTMMAGTSFIARQDTSTIPDSLADDILSRVIRDKTSGTEAIIHAHPNTSIREVLEDRWPFRGKRSGNWFVVDEKGNDVTNWPISNWDGIAYLHHHE